MPEVTLSSQSGTMNLTTGDSDYAPPSLPLTLIPLCRAGTCSPLLASVWGVDPWSGVKGLCLVNSRKSCCKKSNAAISWKVWFGNFLYLRQQRRRWYSRCSCCPGRKWCKAGSCPLKQKEPSDRCSIYLSVRGRVWKWCVGLWGGHQCQWGIMRSGEYIHYTHVFCIYVYNAVKRGL